MSYSEIYSTLKQKYNTVTNTLINFPDRGTTIRNCVFQSSHNIVLKASSHSPTSSIFFNSSVWGETNSNFFYPVVRPGTKIAGRKAIIMLHGLNEKNWDKYLTWAHSLAELTGKSVIMFPIAFHMNRAPENWNNPHIMSPFVTERKKNFPDVQSLSYVNLALSERLTSQPERFFLSGYQAANDLLQLIDSLKKGEHPMFDKNTSVDFFAYSIGVLLSQVLLLANPGNRLSNSRFFFFCGGSVFEGMNGISKYILDSGAFNRIFSFYCSPQNEPIGKSSLFANLLNRTLLGNAFRSLISFSELKKIPSISLSRFVKQTRTICLKNDRVIPADHIRNTLHPADVEVWNFDYPYSHENPFPLLNNKLNSVVDKAFEAVFKQAGLYLT